MDIDQVRLRCLGHPDFAEGTAYTRTKICCRVLVMMGEPIPSWMIIRDCIEKGSATDINRGVKDFRAEHGEQLRQMGSAVEGLPPQLAPIVRGLWEAAVAEARKLHAEDVAQWQARVEAAEAHVGVASQAVERAHTEVEAARGQTDALRAQLAADAEVRVQLQQQLDRERDLRRYAEQMRDDNAAELAKQRSRLEETLAQSQAEMKQALDRFDGERKHSLRQIEEARSNAEREVKDIRDHAIRMEAELRKKLEDTTNNNTALRSQFDLHNAKIATLTQERQSLQATVARLEQQNRSMVELVRKPNSGGVKPRSQRSHSKPLRKKNRLAG